MYFDTLGSYLFSEIDLIDTYLSLLLLEMHLLHFNMSVFHFTHVFIILPATMNGIKIWAFFLHLFADIVFHLLAAGVNLGYLHLVREGQKST